MAAAHVIAVDLGATSGRVMDVRFDGRRLKMAEVHRFPNIPVTVQGVLYWDALRLWHDITEGIAAVPPGAASIGVDSWGVDFAFLDRGGRLLSNPLHYRNQHDNTMMDWVFERVPRREVFERTGIQFMPINSLYQLAMLLRDGSPLLDMADTLLTIPDLFNYWLTGSKTCEFTHVTTTQLYNPNKHTWDMDMLARVGLPTRIFKDVVTPGTRIGSYEGISVIVPACHDTGSAVVAVPTTTHNYAYLSSGTWSLLGLELDHAVINDDAYAANVTNEGGVNGTFRLLKNIMGQWLIQQSRSAWMSAGQEYSYEELGVLAAQAEPFWSLIDPDDLLFLPPGDMPARIMAFCRQHGQPVPETPGQITRTIYEGLALKYRHALEQLITVSGQPVERVHIIGGGANNAQLCQMAANATGRLVSAGPVEATALGNAIVQLIALGEIGSLTEARELLSRTEVTATYEPRDTALWDEQYARFKAAFGES
ncbi:MAG: rhamnulokinase [Anaerolineae bacterium]|nr:rhamnulokinase [Anaerolineae bacterium]